MAETERFDLKRHKRCGHPTGYHCCCEERESRTSVVDVVDFMERTAQRFAHPERRARQWFEE